MSKKMTEREFLNCVIKVMDMSEDVEIYNAKKVNKDEFATVLGEEIKEWAEEKIKKLDERNAYKSNKQTAKQKENEPIKAEILEVMTDEPMTAKEIVEKLDSKYSVNKVSAICRSLGNDNMIEIEGGRVNKYFKK